MSRVKESYQFAMKPPKSIPETAVKMLIRRESKSAKGEKDLLMIR